MKKTVKIVLSVLGFQVGPELQKRVGLCMSCKRRCKAQFKGLA